MESEGCEEHGRAVPGDARFPKREDEDGVTGVQGGQGAIER